MASLIRLPEGFSTPGVDQTPRRAVAVYAAGHLPGRLEGECASQQAPTGAPRRTGEAVDGEGVEPPVAGVDKSV